MIDRFFDPSPLVLPDPTQEVAIYWEWDECDEDDYDPNDVTGSAIAQ